METTELVPIKIDLKEAQKQVDFYEQECLSVEIKNQEQMNEAVEWIRTMEKFGKELEEERLKATRPIDQTKKVVMGWFKPYEERIEKFTKFLRSKVDRFRDEQRRIAEEEQQKLQAEAEKKRKELAAKAQAELEKGNQDKADKLLAKAETVAAPIVRPAVEAPAGTFEVTKWYFRITDKDSIPREYLMPDEAMLGKVASATKGTLKIPGVEFFKEVKTAIRK